MHNCSSMCPSVRLSSCATMLHSLFRCVLRRCWQHVLSARWQIFDKVPYAHNNNKSVHTCIQQQYIQQPLKLLIVIVILLLLCFPCPAAYLHLIDIYSHFLFLWSGYVRGPTTSLLSLNSKWHEHNGLMGIFRLKMWRMRLWLLL